MKIKSFIFKNILQTSAQFKHKSKFVPQSTRRHTIGILAVGLMISAHDTLHIQIRTISF